VDRVRDIANSITGRLVDPLVGSMESARSIDIICSFIMNSGVESLKETLLDAKNRGVPVRLLTGTYLNITNPHAIKMLKDICGNSIQIRFYRGTNSFHPKAYFVYGESDAELYVGSSNMSRSALVDGVEWNYRISRNENPRDFEKFREAFELLFNSDEFSVEVDESVLREYRGTWVPIPFQRTAASPRDASLDFAPEPNDVQAEALHGLWLTRSKGLNKALVVAATGVGKTYLAAFDTVSDPAFKRVLFVAHTEDILKQAKDSFSRVRPKDSMGMFYGKGRDLEKDVTFATVQTLSRRLGEISADAFDYIVVDEFHHAAAPTYRKVLEHFRPKFLLGLTATPERMDNKDIFALCDYNVVYEIGLKEAIERGFLSSFSYYGIYDDVDYDKIRYVGGRYDAQDLDAALINEKRNEKILRHFLKYDSRRAIGFCSSIKHAESVAKHFAENTRLRVATVASAGDSKHRVDRESAIGRLAAGELDVVFVVDMFNEGIDVPAVDLVMFLRPTESYTVFTQQLGRGLRLSPGKERLIALDFIGNYRNVAMLPHVLSGERGSCGGPGIPTPPRGCTIDFDLEAKDILREMALRETKKEDLIESEYRRVKEMLGRVPSRVELFLEMDPYVYGIVKKNSGLNPFRDYLGFLHGRGELESDPIRVSFLDTVAGEFIRFVERTAMSRLYKMPVLLAFFSEKSVDFKPSAEKIVSSFEKFYSENNNRVDIANLKNPPKNWLSLAKSQPMHFLCKQNPEFFSLEDGLITLSGELEGPALSSKFRAEVLDAIAYRTMDFKKTRYDEGLNGRL